MVSVRRWDRGPLSRLLVVVPVVFSAGPTMAALPFQTVTPESLIELCARKALTPGEIWAMRTGGLLTDLLEYTYDQCPDVAEMLLNGVATTAITPPAGRGHDDKD